MEEPQLTNHITNLVRQEVSHLAQVTEMEATLPQELVSVRAQLAALRWAATAPRADWRVRLEDVEVQQAHVTKLLEALTHPADGPARRAMHELLLCLHGQSSALNWALLFVKGS